MFGGEIRVWENIFSSRWIVMRLLCMLGSFGVLGIWSYSMGLILEARMLWDSFFSSPISVSLLIIWEALPANSSLGQDAEHMVCK